MLENEQNREIMAGVMDALSRGDTKPFAEAMADDFTWRLTGSTAWSGVYAGKDDVRGRLIKALFAQFSTTYTNTPRRILADGDHVVVECRGEVSTTKGKSYNNEYCWVVRMREGKMAELTEYFDTALVTDALDPPPWA